MIYRFDGPDYVHERDGSRLTEQMHRVFAVLRDCRFHTLEELEKLAEAPQASISARLRDLRKPRFGQYLIEKEYRGNGLFAYRLAGRIVPDGKQAELAI